VRGWLALYDHIDPEDLRKSGAPHDRIGIRISDSDFHCEGDYCRLSCSPFEPASLRPYEFTGRLRLKQGGRAAPRRPGFGPIKSARGWELDAHPDGGIRLLASMSPVCGIARA
jgi:hypothetical protein